MTFATLLDKLIQIEVAASAGDFASVRSLTLEAEEMVLHLEREIIDVLHEKAHKDAARFRNVPALPPC
ncbi:MAG TPA: hypothetical protein VJS11_02250 [Acidobacteriaceae bacterium]|nr:hypothetical protein [Acidobacteriaceae bacterium]